MRFALASLTAGLLIVNGCTEQPTVDRIAAPALVFSSSRTTLASVPVRVQIRMSEPDGTVCKICGDAQGDYMNGSQNVQAVIDAHGDFIFDTKASVSKAAVRWVQYDFSSPVDPGNTYRPSPSNSLDFHFATSPSNLSPAVSLQTLAIGNNECVALGGGFSSPTTSWRVSFHRGYEDNSTSPASYALVTRVASASWTVVPVAACGDLTSNVAALRSGDGSQLYGYWKLPFSFVLTAL